MIKFICIFLSLLVLGYAQEETAMEPYHFNGEKLLLSEEEWQNKLTPEEYKVLRNKGTEPAFCAAYFNFPEDDGLFVCKGCALPLFSSEAKFNSHTGWPSFYDPIFKENVSYKLDNSLGYQRVEILCSRCDGHLGHVFNDGPPPSGRRYCLNQIALKFIPK